MLAVVIMIFAFMALADFSKLIREKKQKEIIVLVGFYGVVTTLAVILVLKGSLPSPLSGVRYLLGNVLHLRYPGY
ncbi:hypothetical protein IZU99_05745 [Oscillospiraceae bacterium CM]|nr:hypothetical protein IZU99_05745 [Oscillospiraceae bacterium CM]